MVSLTQDVGERLYRIVHSYRKANKLTHHEFYKQSGVNLMYSKRWLRGESYPKDATVLKLERFTSLNLEQFKLEELIRVKYLLNKKPKCRLKYD